MPFFTPLYQQTIFINKYCHVQNATRDRLATFTNVIKIQQL